MPDILPAICWIVGAEDLGEDEIPQDDDYCYNCADKKVKELKEKYPEHADFITVDGGYEDCRDSDDLAHCTECEQPLSCYLTTAWIDSAWTDEDREIFTKADWRKADARICADEGL